MSRSLNVLMICGALLALLGVAGLVSPMFTTHQTKDVASVGDLKVQTKEDTTHVVPPMVSGGALVLGLILIGGGFYKRS